MPKAAFFSNSQRLIAHVYPEDRLASLGQLTFYPEVITRDSFASHVANLSDVEFIFSTWGMPELTGDEIAQMPMLSAVFYAAGTVKYFAKPFLDQGVRIFSAWAANAVPVGEFTAAQIVLANKSFFRANRLMQQGEKPRGLRMSGNYGTGVALLGAGMVGREVIRCLGHCDLTISVFDPFLDSASAQQLGVSKVGLAEAFRDYTVVSNHLANVPETEGMITGDLMASLPEGATFINTGRGATVRENEMVDVLRSRPDITALLDVTDPEPPEPGSDLYDLPNVWLTPHIAGSLGNEVVRMGDLMIEEFHRDQAGDGVRYEVFADQLVTMA